MKDWLEQSPILVGVALAVAGFVAIFLAWNGAAGKDTIQEQFPYLISGGLTGLGLIGIGITVVVVQARRRDSAELAARLEELTAATRGEQVGPAPTAAERKTSSRPSTRKRPSARKRSSAKRRSRQPR